MKSLLNWFLLLAMLAVTIGCGGTEPPKAAEPKKDRTPPPKK
jgi:hypothetical protein